jgi:hypothetical protein
MRAAVQAIAPAIVILIAASCRQVIGIPDPEPPLACAAPTATPPTCAACLVGACCAELDECQKDATCAALLACTAGCTSDACRADCETKHALTASAAKVLACEVSRCEAACALTCGAAGPPVSECKPCASTCCVEGTAFHGSLDGQMLRVCRAGCAPGDIDCRERCANEHPAGADLELAARECVVRGCRVTGDWSCVGKTDEPAPATGPIVLSIYVADQFSGAALAGATVRGCTPDDLACTSPFATVKTNGGGRAGLTVPLTQRPGFQAYPGYLEISRDDYMTFLVYFAPALTATREVGIGMASKEFVRRAEATSGITLLSDRGTLIGGALDCAHLGSNGLASPGIAIRADTADGLSRTFYGRTATTGGPTLDFTATSTSEAGYGGIANLPAGTLHMTTFVDGLCLATGTTEVGIRAGAVTYVNVEPLP